MLLFLPNYCKFSYDFEENRGLHSKLFLVHNKPIPESWRWCLENLSSGCRLFYLQTLDTLLVFTDEGFQNLWFFVQLINDKYMTPFMKCLLISAKTKSAKCYYTKILFVYV